MTWKSGCNGKKRGRGQKIRRALHAICDDVSTDVSNDLELGNEDIMSSDPHCNEVTNEALNDHVAKWILKTGETRCLKRSAMSGIVDVSDITELMVSDLQCQVTSIS